MKRVEPGAALDAVPGLAADASIATAAEPCPEPPTVIDPLRGLRPADAPPTDLFVAGKVYFDIIFSGLSAAPDPGTEALCSGLGSGPGGVANLAVAARRLGLRTSLAAAFGADVYGDYLWSTLSGQERVDLSASRRYAGWPTPVTVSFGSAGDRSMITYEEPAPADLDHQVGDPPPALACVVPLERCAAGWAARARAAGSVLLAGTGWDPTGQWPAEALRRLDVCEVFVCNCAEATAYTRTDDPRHALDRLAEHVAVVVVTCGASGAYALDQRRGERVYEPALRVEALDPTGAGDVFTSAFVIGTLAGWPLAHRVRLANLAAALSVCHFGGSLGAPCWHDIAAWWASVLATTTVHDPLRQAYAFLTDLLPDDAEPDVPRATPTIGLRLPGPRQAPEGLSGQPARPGTSTV